MNCYLCGSILLAGRPTGELITCNLCCQHVCCEHVKWCDRCGNRYYCEIHLPPHCLQRICEETLGPASPHPSDDEDEYDSEFED